MMEDLNASLKADYVGRHGENRSRRQLSSLVRGTILLELLSHIPKIFVPFQPLCRVDFVMARLKIILQVSHFAI